MTIFGMGKYFILLLLAISHMGYAQSSKPNILWITIEDTSPQFIGAYGNSDAKTPNMDRLAEEGVRFNNAFATNTVCSASRSTIITGVRTYKMGTGNHRSNYPVPNYIKGFPYYLQQQGYYTSNNSKTDYNVKDMKAFIKEAWDESSNTAGWWKREEGEPFFSVFNFATSHQSRTMTWPYEQYVKNVLTNIPESERIPESAFSMPPFYHDTPAMRKQFARVYNSIQLTDTKIGALLDRLEEDGLKDDTIIFMYADHGEGIPRGKTNGINLGYRVPFMIWFPEKYKESSPWGTQVVTDELVSFEDLAPTLISMAGGDPPDHMKGRVLIGEDRSKPVDQLFLSSDRADNGIDMVRTVTDGRYIYSKNYLPFMPQMRYINYFEIGKIQQEMRKDYAQGELNKLQESLFEPRPAEYLYDIENDLWETNNLVNDPEAQPVLERMREQLRDEILRSRDVMFLPEYEISQISDHTTPYEYRLDSSQYHFKKIYEIASLSGRRGSDIAKQQIEALESPHKIVRYWATVGLRSQPSAVLQPYVEKIEAMIADAYPPTAITASVIAYQESGSDEAEARLTEALRGDNAELLLWTVNHLLYIEEKAPFVKAVKMLQTREGLPYKVTSACNDFLDNIPG